MPAIFPIPNPGQQNMAGENVDVPNRDVLQRAASEHDEPQRAAPQRAALQRAGPKRVVPVQAVVDDVPRDAPQLAASERVEEGIGSIQIPPQPSMVPLEDIVRKIVITCEPEPDGNDVKIVITCEPEPDIDLSKLPPKPSRPTPRLEPAGDPTDTNQTYPRGPPAPPPPTRHPRYDGAQDPPDNNPYPTAGRRD